MKLKANATVGLLSSAMVAVLSACGGGSGAAQAQDVNAQAAAAPFVDSFASADPNHLTLAVKFVEYADAAGNPILNQQQAQKLVDGMNALYASCNLHLKIEDYQIVNPADHGLEYAPTAASSMSDIRAPFDTPSALVIVNTGPWDHGSMGAANAWTSMPGSNPSGAVIDSAVAGMDHLIAHELGHYLSLDHSGDGTNMMSPIVYPDSKQLTQGQCEEMRASAKRDRAQALR